MKEKSLILKLVATLICMMSAATNVNAMDETYGMDDIETRPTTTVGTIEPIVMKPVTTVRTIKSEPTNEIITTVPVQNKEELKKFNEKFKKIHGVSPANYFPEVDPKYDNK